MRLGADGVGALGRRGRGEFVLVTPEYNYGYPASLKNAIDWYYDAWNAKPVAFENVTAPLDDEPRST